MRVTEILDPRAVLDLQGTSADAVITELVQTAVEVYPLTEEVEHIIDVVRARERLGSTGLGGGVAIPHERFPTMAQHVLVVGRAPQGVDFQAPDGDPVQVFFLVLGPPRVKEHVAILKAIASVCLSECFVERVLAAPDPAGVYELLDTLEV
jgi:PTS system nitrogen regulatory IIA component